MAKPKLSIFLCCFGSSSHANMESSPTKGYDPMISKTKKKKKKKKKNKSTSSTSWFSWPRIPFNKTSSYKTVPLEPSITANHLHNSKSKSKSTLHHKPQAPATNLSPPPQPAPVLPATPYYTPTQTRHGANGNNVEDTRQQGRSSQAEAKRQAGKKARKSYDPVVGMSVVVVTLVIMIFWGRLCAILCTSAWLCCTRLLRRKGSGGGVNDDPDPETTKRNELDLDSEEYKKKVIMEGLLGRNHRTIML